jgi:tetratricopeptide (TPR) repeat protein
MSWIFTACAELRRAGRPRRRPLAPPAPRRPLLPPLLALLSLAAGCAQVRGRKLLQEADELYKRGQYTQAVALFERAEPLVPELPVLWLNKGYTCRQLIAPGSDSPQSRRAATCALDAFQRLRALAPGDPRGEQLYVQTLFDANDFAVLETLFLVQNGQAAKRAGDRAGGAVDLDAAAGLQQVYFKWGKWPQALFWARRAAGARPGDAEAQYGVGAFIWQILSSRGGGAEMASFDPRPRPDGAAPPVPPPAADDISGALRIDLADEGVRYLEKALVLRPSYPDAMTYLNLLYRQKSFAYFADAQRWQAAVDSANQWQKTALGARGGARP